MVDVSTISVPGVYLKMNALPRLPQLWVDDGEAPSCYSCGVAFTLWNRRHHCRMCGCVFCGTCTPHTGTIPSYMQTYPTEDDVRLCGSCHAMCTQTQSSDRMIRVFSLLGLMPRDFGHVACVSRTWYHVANTLMSVYKAIPYKLSYSRYSSLERNVLRANMHMFAGHSCWTLQCARIHLLPKGKRVCSCAELMCARDCTSTLEPRHVLQLLCTFPSVDLLRDRVLREWIRNIFRRVDVEMHVLFMPWWTMLAKTSKVFAQQFLLPLCVAQKRVAYALYFECETEMCEPLTRLQRTLLTRIPQGWASDLRQTKRLMQYVDEFVAGTREECPVRPSYTVCMPYDPRVLCTGIGTVEQLDSATRPHVVRMDTNKGKVSILVKNEDVRRDRYAMVMARMLDVLCGVRCVDYTVFPMRGRGWIVMLRGARTLFSLGNGLSAHVYNTYRGATVQTIRRRFVRSTVGACILSFVLGVGDRHLQNMVLTSGEIAHIDFSYLLGHDPKLRIDIRITTQMIDVMGGRDSPDYAQFLTWVQDAYNQCRKYTQFWFTSMQYLSDIELYTLREIREHVCRKLLPGQLESTAATRIVDVVKNGSDSWRHAVSDVTHQLFHLEL